MILLKLPRSKIRIANLLHGGLSWNTNLRSIVYSLFVFFCFFPYLKILGLPTDAQPNALLLGTLILLLHLTDKYSIQKIAIYLGLFLGFFISLPFLGTFGFSEMKSLISYVSLFVVSIASFQYFSCGRKLNFKFFKWTLLINVSVSFIQLFYSKYFLTFLTHRVNTTDSRGVTGLAPEPSLNAMTAILLFVVYLLNFYPKGNRWVVPAMIIWIVFMAQSSVVLLFSMISIGFFLFFFYPLRLIKFSILLLAIVASAFLLVDIDPARYGRITFIFYNIISNPELFINLDRSINDRFTHLVAPFVLLIENFGLPHGPNYEYFNSRIFEIKHTSFPYFFSKHSGVTVFNRIMSGWGMVVFECGFFGLIFIGYYLKNGIRLAKRSKHYALAILIFFIMMFNALSVNTALVPFIIGNVFYLSFSELGNAKLRQQHY